MSFNQMDLVQLKTTKRVRFMSGPPGHAASPHGNWSIVGFIDGDAFVAKNSTIVRIPLDDLQAVASMSTETLMEALKDINPKGKLFSAVEHIARVFDVDVNRAKQLVISYNLPMFVGSTAELDQITTRIKDDHDQKEGRRTNRPGPHQG